MAKSSNKQLAASSAATAAPARSPRQATVKNTGKKAVPGSKQARVIAVLQSPAGATIATMMKATGWQQHSVRGFLAGVVRRRLKLKLGSKKVDGTRVYQIPGAESSQPGRKSRGRSS